MSLREGADLEHVQLHPFLAYPYRPAEILLFGIELSSEPPEFHSLIHLVAPFLPLVRSHPGTPPPNMAIEPLLFMPLRVEPSLNRPEGRPVPAMRALASGLVEAVGVLVLALP